MNFEPISAKNLAEMGSKFFIVAEVNIGLVMGTLEEEKNPT